MDEAAGVDAGFGFVAVGGGASSSEKDSHAASWIVTIRGISKSSAQICPRNLTHISLVIQYALLLHDPSFASPAAIARI